MQSGSGDGSISTIYEVARLAGVSVATASRALNNTGYVSKEARTRVLEAARQLNYHINVNARSLTSGKTYTIALVLPDVTNPFFPAVARGVEDAASRKGYSVILCNTDGSARKEADYLNMLRSRRVDGIIFTTSELSGARISSIIGTSTAVVLVDRDLGEPYDIVKTDNVKGGFLATNHLISLGHTRIAVISGPLSLTTGLERVQGYKNALAQAGIPFDESLVVEGDFRQQGGRAAMERLIEECGGKPSTKFSAVFACNDLMAVGALTALEDHGIAVPSEVAVVGYDDIAFASVTRPRLSTVAQPKYEMGVLAAEMLLRRMANPALPRQQEVLQPMLVIRDSTLERSLKCG